MQRIFLLLVSHGLALFAGFALGVYLLPILTAPAGPTAEEVESAARSARYEGRFVRDLEGSDLLHWGEGEVTVSPDAITLMGRVSPGPDYKLYLAPEFVDTEAEFLAIKARSARVAEIKTFENFVVPVPSGIDVEKFNTVVVWCETFGQFITAVQYR